MNRAGCPSQDELAEFATGHLPRPVLDRVADHVEGCPTCETALQALDGLGDPLLSQLRRPADVDTLLASGVPAEVIAAARSARLDRSPAAWLSAGEPRRIGKFELLEALGTGSFGTVFRARDTDLDRVVAIKVLRAGRLAGQEDVDRFLREARSAAQLKHPGIVALYDTGHEDGTWYLVEEFVQGETLAAWIKRGALQRPGERGPDCRRAAGLLAEVAEALDYAHRHGVVHRDITPANIMIDLQGRPHLMDFGLAKREADETTMTLEGQVLGTPAYMSPEQARGESRDVDARSDIYSLGVILYELVTGERPFRGNRRMLLLQVLNDDPRAPRRLNDRVPRDLETICLKAIAKAPARRYGTAREMADDLHRFLAGEPIHARPEGTVERVWRWCRRNPVPASLLVAVTLGSAFGLWHLTRLSEHLVRSAALESAAQQAEILDMVNSRYSSEVVDRVGSQGVPATHDYATRKGAIPLPATLIKELGQYISERSATGMQVRLYSDYPFRTRTDGGPKDDFERAALVRLRENPDEPFYRFEDFEGRPSLRYASARRMAEACVRCHNTHPDSTKKDWKVDDVPGVLEIIRPLANDVERTRVGLRSTFVLMAVVSGSLLGLSIFVLVMSNRRRGAVPPSS